MSVAGWNWLSTNEIAIGSRKLEWHVCRSHLSGLSCDYLYQESRFPFGSAGSAGRCSTDKSQHSWLSGQYGQSLLQDEGYRRFSVHLRQSITCVAQALVTDDTDDWTHSSKPHFSKKQASEAQAFSHELQALALTWLCKSRFCDVSMSKPVAKSQCGKIWILMPSCRSQNS